PVRRLLRRGHGPLRDRRGALAAARPVPPRVPGGTGALPGAGPGARPAPGPGAGPSAGPVKFRLPIHRRPIYHRNVPDSSGPPGGGALGGFGRYAGPATLILSSLADGPKHGYALTKDIEQFSGLRLAPGTLYEALSRLESQGLIEALESQDRRRPYR